MRSIRVVVIDSGVSNDFSHYKKIVGKYTIIECDGKIRLKEGQAEDKIGHGTAICSILVDLVPDIEMICVKIIDDESEITIEQLIYALKYIYNNISCDLVNISLGVQIISQIKELEEICTAFNEKGISILAAFDNNGAISYPAALQQVIGVDKERGYKSRKDYTYIQGKVINLIFGEVYYKVEWLHQQKTLIKGTSFATAYATGLIAKHLLEEHISTSKENVEEILKTNAKLVIDNNEKEIDCKPHFEIKKAILFPYNKEIHALVRYSDYLKFEVTGVYDEPLKGKVNTKAYGKTIKSYESIKWEEDFDTLILGCCDELQEITNKHYKEILIEKCKQYHKNIYSFEYVESDDTKIFYPAVGIEDIPQYRFSKLRRSNTPVVGVVGTSSQQGKFSLQIELKNQLEVYGYKVGHISTEPSGYLFDADFVFPIGYNSTVDYRLNLFDYITILNEELWKIEKEGKEIIIVGNQSGSIHYDNGNLGQYAVFQHGFLLGTLPDKYILCVNPNDPIEYIKRTIAYLNAIDSGNVSLIGIYPVQKIFAKNDIGLREEVVSQDELKKLKTYLEKETQLPTFIMGIKEEIKRACDKIIEEFTYE